MLRRLLVSAAAITALTGAVFVADASVSTTPAFADSGCYSSKAGDVDDLASGTVVHAPEADLLAVCVDYNDERVQVTARAAEPISGEN